MLLLGLARRASVVRVETRARNRILTAAVDAAGRHLYACTEWAGRNEGLVAALDIDPEDGSLSYINMQPTLGSIACHVSPDRAGALLFAANFTIAPEGAPT